MHTVAVHLCIATGPGDHRKLSGLILEAYNRPLCTHGYIIEKSLFESTSLHMRVLHAIAVTALAVR